MGKGNMPVARVASASKPAAHIRQAPAMGGVGNETRGLAGRTAAGSDPKLSIGKPSSVLHGEHPTSQATGHGGMKDSANVRHEKLSGMKPCCK
jgi:hypothetical protein